MIHLTSQNFSTKEIIQNVFSPLIGAVCSPQAEEICQKNNLSFVEMLQPFSRLSTDAPFKDTAGNSVSIKGIRLNICDVTWRPPQTILARKMLNEAVSSVQCEKTKIVTIDETAFLEIPSSEPWYEQWRETFLTVQFPADHEFTRHFLSCLIVLSSSDPNPLDSANQLTRKVQMLQNVTPPKLPKWFSADPLNCYIMLHDGCQGDITKAQQGFESLKLTFGENKCFLLQINSHQGNPGEYPDPWLRYLKRHAKSDPSQTEQDSSTPRTPQDITSVTSMPNSVQMSTLETPPSGIIASEVVFHPLSPVQEIASDVISTLSTSTDSLSSQLLNPNVWASEPDTTDQPHGMWLTANDVDILRHFIQDYTVRALIPYIEKMVSALNDSIANKKGVSRSFLTATKRWFVTNKPGVGTAQNAVVYTNESTELQTRKLGDLYFMFGQYPLAFQAYHQAKRDFNADSAWQYYAGALEMAALSAFMQGTANRKTYDYMEEAIVTYSNICKLPQFATRATILSIECLKIAKLYGEAAKQLIRMTSEDSDLRSALLLEQAAYSFLSSQPPLFRKYAFHSVLAGHRFSKAGQRKHAFRCYKQSYQVFDNRGWSLAEDHIQYTIGKQAITLKKLDEASGALSHLLRPSSLQSSTQQSAFLREYIATHKSLQSQAEYADLLNISLPRIVQNMTKVLVTSQPPVANPHMVPASNININSTQDDNWKWTKLEEMAVYMASKKPVMIFKPSRFLFTNETINSENPYCIHGEPIEISVTLENTIKLPIVFGDINLLWSFSKEDGEICTNCHLFKSDSISLADKEELDNIVLATTINSLTINEYEFKTILFKLTPKFIGTLKVTGIIGRLSALNDTSSLWGKLEFEDIPIKNKEPPSGTEKSLDYDKKLEIKVLQPAPALCVSFSQIPEEVLAGEIIPVTVNMTNTGAGALGDIYIAIENPRWILVNQEVTELPLSVLRHYKDLTNENLSRDKEARKQHVFKVFESSDKLLQPNESRIATLWLQIPYKKGPSDLKILLYYSMPPDYPILKHRLIRHVWHFNINESILMETNCNIGNPNTNELGLDINVKNLNQVHHAVMTEITLNKLDLYCSEYHINPDKIVYMNSPGYLRISTESVGLKSTESMSIRCPLKKVESNDEVSSIDKFLKLKLSEFSISSYPDIKKYIPPFSQIASFLMKNETKYIRVFGQNSNNEEFNQIITVPDQHMTLAVTWKAEIYDNGSIQRTAFGQHFTQLRFLYESVYCPAKDRLHQNSFTSHEEKYSIYDFVDLVKKPDDTEDDDWAVQNISVSRRCFLEEELQCPQTQSGKVF